jgi:NADPH:quinone reductase
VKAAVYDEAGSPNVLRYVEVLDPTISSGDVLISVQAISIEGGDLINRRLMTPPHPSWTIGYAAAGIIKAVGSSIKNRMVGDRVAAFHTYGSHAELWAVPATRTWIIPDDVDVEDAAVIPISFGTASRCLFARGGLRCSETVLIHAAAGGLGIAAVQLAVGARAHVLAVTSGAERCKKLQALGAYHVIDRATCDVLSEVMRVTGNRGVDVALDPIGTTLPISISALAPEGRLIFVGNAGGTNMDVNLWKSMQSNHTLLGVFMGTQLEKHSAWSMVDSIFQDLAKRRIRAVIDRTFRLSHAAAAHAYAETAKPFGRVVLKP